MSEQMTTERVGFEDWLGITPKGAAHDLAYEAFRAGAAWQRAQGAGVPDVSAMAKALSDRAASACCVDPDDNWKIYGQDYIEDVRAMLAAAPAAPAGQEHAAEQPDTVGVPRKLLAEAERIIDSYAEALKECHAPGGDWTGEEAAQDDYEHEAGVALELRAILAIAQIQERNT